MSVAGNVAVAVAERVEKTGGPKAGLVAWKTLAQNSAAAEVRGRAILSALRCAVALREPAPVKELASLWETVDRGVWDAELYALCKEMAKQRLPAIELAHAEVRRHRSARALYAYARCFDVAGDPRAAAAFADAIERAEKEGNIELVTAARVRRAAWLAKSWDTLDAAIEEAKRIDLNVARPADRIVLAKILLFSPSRFVRAGAIGALDLLVTGLDAALAARALLVCARFADDAAPALTSLEIDRLSAIFGREAVTKVAEGAKSAFFASVKLAQAKSEDVLVDAMKSALEIAPEIAPLNSRAQDVLRGRYEPFVAIPSDRATAALLLDAAVALRDGPPPRAAATLRMLAEKAERGERIPPRAFSLAEVALASEDAELRGVAARLVKAMMERPRPCAPPRGFLGLANALALAGMEDLAGTVRRAAALWREPGAAESLALALTRSGWQLASAGDRRQAIARLREAKALASTSAPAPSAGANRSK